ncbi:hypothetical protein CVT25_011777 [Psilocybe cyanescens]|uniref:Uncharacterized protein n=1 Tax=Psilocybe cyanescens TaxID=93625 RepID=A0A409WJ86_PSICY|nr:hypothetical protein CVT25_011777 [Psilocybe cyanescens]
MSGAQNPTDFASSTIDNLSAQASDFTAPILQILPYITLAFSVLQAIFSFILSLFRPLLHLSPLPILLYVLAPVIVFLDIVATIIIRAPYRTITYLLEELFPLYVFCGVACITGVLLGLSARVLARAIVTAVALDQESSDSPNLTQPEDEPKADIKGKGKKVERVKFEL